MRKFGNAAPSSSIGVTLNDQGMRLHGLGDHEGARRAFEQALAEFERSGHGGDSRTGTTKGNLAMALTKLGRTSEAETAYREAIAIVSARKQRHARGGCDVQGQPRRAPDLARALRRGGSLAQASLDARRAKGDGKHYMVGQSLEMLASVQATTGDLEAAERLQREALSTYIAALGESAPPTVKSRSALASLLAKSGKLEDALTEAQAASALAARSLDARDPTRWTVLRSEALVLSARGDRDHASKKLREVLDQFSSLLGDADPETRQTLLALVDLLRKSGQSSEADALERRADASPASRGRSDRPVPKLSRRSRRGPPWRQLYAALSQLVLLLRHSVLVDHERERLRANVSGGEVAVAAKGPGGLAPRVLREVERAAVLVLRDADDVHQVVVGRVTSAAEHRVADFLRHGAWLLELRRQLRDAVVETGLADVAVDGRRYPLRKAWSRISMNSSIGTFQ